MDTPHRGKLALKSRLVGVTRAGKPVAPVVAAPAPPPPAAATPATPIEEPSRVRERELASDIQALHNLLAELRALRQQSLARQRATTAEIAQNCVELGVALAERLLGAEIAADRQGIARLVRDALERMPAARAITVHGHPADLALLERQLGETPDLASYRDVLAARPDESLRRGQWKLDTAEWFVDWDVQRSLAEMRGALLQESLMEG